MLKTKCVKTCQMNLEKNLDRSSSQRPGFKNRIQFSALLKVDDDGNAVGIDSLVTMHQKHRHVCPQDQVRCEIPYDFSQWVLMLSKNIRL